MNNFLGGSILVVILTMIALAIFWPFVLIWAANTLFGFGIAYTFKTWLAALILIATFGKTSASATVKKD